MAKTKNIKPESSSDSSSDESSVAPPPAKKAAPAAKAAPAKPVKKVETSSSDSSSSEDEKPVAKPAAKPAAKAAPAKPTKKADTSSDSDSSSESEDEKPAPKKAAAAPAKVTPAKPAAKRPAESSSSDSSSSESESEEEAPKPAAKKLKVDTAPAAASEENGPHKIYVKGLPWKASEAEVKDFFKGCGKIVSAELPVDDSGRSSGTAFVVFSKRSELDAALELDGQMWPNTERWLKIQEARSMGPRTPGTPGAGVRPEGCNTVFVGNLPWDVEENQLREIFGTCGEIDRVRFATNPETGEFKGFGHVQFVDGESTDAAVLLAGTDVNGRAIRVDYAPPRNREGTTPGGGRGGRGGASPGGRGRGGRDAGGRGGRGGGRGRGGGFNANKGTISMGAAAGGKKMTFGDDDE
jgi:nucleolin